MGKPSYDLIVDDKSYNYNNSWIKDLENKFMIDFNRRSVTLKNLFKFYFLKY